MQATILAVKTAIDSIKKSGFSFAGQRITHGHVGIYRFTPDYAGQGDSYYLVPLFYGDDFPLRRIVQDADGSYRCASPHIGKMVLGANTTLEEAAHAYMDDKAGVITHVIAFGIAPEVVEPISPLLPEPDKATVDSILLELALTDFTADQYVPAIINGETVVLLVHNGFAEHNTVEAIASLGDNLLCVSNESAYIALGNGVLYVIQAEAQQRPNIGAKRLAKNKLIIEACLKANGKLVDGHGNGDGFTRPTHIALFGTPGRREIVVALYEGKNFCLNQIDLEDDGVTPVVTSCSVGGNLFQPEVEMVDRIHTYSDWDRNTLWNLVSLTK